MKQKAFAKINSKKKALCKQTALDKATTTLSKQALYTALYTTALK